MSTRSTRREVLKKLGLTGALIAIPGVSSLVARKAEAAPSPQRRIAAAMREIEGALADLYPGHFITQHAGLREGSGGVVIGAYPVEGYRASFHWRDDGPLLPADAGCHSYDWIAHDIPPEGQA